MSRRPAGSCSACSHPLRHKLDRDLSCGNGTMREIAARFGVSTRVLDRHRPHMMQLEKTPQSKPFDVDMLIKMTRDLASYVLEELVKCKKAGDTREAMGCSRELRGWVDTGFKLASYVDARNSRAIDTTGTSVLSPKAMEEALRQMTDAELRDCTNGAPMPARFLHPRPVIFIPEDSDD